MIRPIRVSDMAIRTKSSSVTIKDKSILVMTVFDDDKTDTRYFDMGRIISPEDLEEFRVKFEAIVNTEHTLNSLSQQEMYDLVT